MNGPRGLPLMKPPYGRITAFNLSTGRAGVDGAERRRAARSRPALVRRSNLGPLGDAIARRAAWRPRRLLFAHGRPIEGARRARRRAAGAGSSAALERGDGQRRSGRWTCARAATGAPMTYMHDGKQYVVVAVGGTDHAAELVALALP